MTRHASLSGAATDLSRRIRVLLVDDSPPTLTALSQFLPQLFPLQIAGRAESGRDALELADQLQPDLVVTDLQMPELGGLELVKLLRAKYPAMKSIVISVYDRPALYEASVQGGADAFIPKERLADELAHQLNRLFCGDDGSQSRGF